MEVRIRKGKPDDTESVLSLLREVQQGMVNRD